MTTRNKDEGKKNRQTHQVKSEKEENRGEEKMGENKQCVLTEEENERKSKTATEKDQKRR